MYNTRSHTLSSTLSLWEISKTSPPLLATSRSRSHSHASESSSRKEGSSNTSRSERAVSARATSHLYLHPFESSPTRLSIIPSRPNPSSSRTRSASPAVAALSSSSCSHSKPRRSPILPISSPSVFASPSPSSNFLSRTSIRLCNSPRRRSTPHCTYSTGWRLALVTGLQASTKVTDRPVGKFGIVRDANSCPNVLLPIPFGPTKP
mmetsp:Transcript_3105/g.8430  ORF Transcript_3105/g.8430 Transcript_3105/m.8430 type:complete len:206 (-) Transcript_3105:323-940(-)